MKRRGDDHDGPLVDRLRAGDEAAFAEVVAAYHDSLVHLALTFVADRGAAEEVAQEAWLGVLRGLRSFERRSSLKTWIFKILVNRARTRGARDGRVLTFSALGQPDSDPSAIADRFAADGRWIHPPSMWREQNPEELLLRHEAVACLQDAVAALPPAQRAVISLRDIEGIDAREVCNILEIGETNQRVLLHRARTRVRAALEHQRQRRSVPPRTKRAAGSSE